MSLTRRAASKRLVKDNEPYPNTIMSPDQPFPPPDSAEMLHRILQAVTPPKPKLHVVEIACAVVLALATTASAWCAYQSKLWGGVQMSRAGASAAASRESAMKSLAAVQKRTFDATMFISYMQARLDGNRAMAEFLAPRFRPEMKAAVEAWLSLDPLHNPAAPPNPLLMTEYVLQETLEIARQEELAAGLLAGTREARRNSDNYVLLTVVFASVLFLGGIARAFDFRSLRITLAALAVLLFAATLAFLTTLPVCLE